MLVGSILPYTGGVQLRVPLILSAMPFMNTGIWMIVFLSCGRQRS